MRGVNFLILIFEDLTKTRTTPGGLSMGLTEAKMQSKRFQSIFFVPRVWVMSLTNGTDTFVKIDNFILDLLLRNQNWKD